MASGYKILLLGDYSNCHANLAKALKQKGHYVMLMAPFNYLSSGQIDIDTARGEGKLGGMALYLKASGLWHNQMKGYDFVAINDPMFMSLKPHRLKKIFIRLKRENGAVFYTSMSTDVNYLRMCAAPESPLRFSEYFLEGKPSPWQLEHPEKWKAWNNPEIIDYQDYIFDNIDGAMSVLYEYHMGLKFRFPQAKIAYGGLPVNTSEIPFLGVNLSGRTKILLCRDRKRIKMKGSDILEEAALKLVERYSDELELDIAENLPFNDFMEKLKRSDVILDQAYSYTPATTALLAMAMGKTVVSGGEPEFYDFIGENSNHPIINATYDSGNLLSTMERTVTDKKFLEKNAFKSREFVEKHNDSMKVAERFVESWNKFCTKS